MMTKILRWNFEKSFLKWEKNGFKNDLPALLRANFLMSILLISNHTVFLVQYELICTCDVFKKLTRAN